MFGREPTHNRRSPFTGPKQPDLKWRFRTDNKVYSSPVLAADGTIYFASRDGSLYAARANGEYLWDYMTDGEILSSPAIGPDGTIYIGSQDNWLLFASKNS